jgi:hypothetical protein
MKTRFLIHLTAALLCAVLTISIQAQTTAFTYQGSLDDNGSPANGLYDLRFEIFDAETNGFSHGAVTNAAVPVAGGIFTVTADFGASVFDGGDRWLEIGAVTNGGGAFTTLLPRQLLSSTPYAIRAAQTDAAGLSGTISSNNIAAGSITSVMLADGAVGTDQLAPGTQFNGTFTGDGSGLIDLHSTSLTGPLTVGALQLRNVGHTNNAGNARGVAVSGDFAYLANGGGGLRIYDITDPANPVNVGHTNNAGNAWDLAVSGNFAYLANREDGLRIYDITDPANPANVGHIDNGAEAIGVAVSGGFAYLANSSDGLRIYDITDPANPVTVGHIDNGGTALSVAVAGNFAYLANDLGGLRLYDITDPAEPVSVNHIDNGGQANGVAVSGNYVYLANLTDGLRIYDLAGSVSAANFLGNFQGSFMGDFVGDFTATGALNLDGNYLSGDGGLEGVFVDVDGKVGIGLDDPQTQLEVEATVPEIRLTDGRASSGGTAGLELGKISWYSRDASAGDDYDPVAAIEVVAQNGTVFPDGKFVFKTGSNGVLTTRMVISQPGSVGIGTTNPSEKLHVMGNILASGTITGSSDLNVKENFTAVDPQAVLAKVAAMPIQRWNYIGETTPHLGPVAQDFHGAFGVGIDDKHISMVDADGVALAAIQGLNQELEQKDARIAKLEQTVSELTDLVNKLNRQVEGTAR